MRAIRLFSLAYPVSALGPGNRVVLWVTGCRRGCPGCISPEMQPADAGRIVSVERLAQRILAIAVPLSGITISGGEPFDQAEALAELLDQLRAARPDWNVVIYSGYRLEEIQEASDKAELLNRLDILVDGPFQRDNSPTHPLAGSANQQVRYLTAAGRALREIVEALPMGAMEYGLSADGCTDMVIGVTREEQRSPFTTACGMPDKSESREPME